MTVYVYDFGGYLMRIYHRCSDGEARAIQFNEERNGYRVEVR